MAMEYRSGGTVAIMKSVWCSQQPMPIKAKVEQKGLGTGGQTMVEIIVAWVISICLGGVVTPIILNKICDKMGWFK